MSETCVLTDKKGIGSPCDGENNFTVPTGGFLTTPDFQFDTYSDFVTEDSYLQGIVDGKVFPIVRVKETEDTSTEDGIYQSPTGEKSKMFEGLRGYIYKVKYTLEMQKALRTYNGGNWKFIPYDKLNNVKGTSPDGTIVTGFELSYLNVGLMANASADTPAFTNIEFQEAIPDEFDRQGVWANPTFLLAKIDAMTVVAVVQVGSIAANAFTMTVNYVDSSQIDSDGNNKSAAISGLVTGAMEVIDQTGAVVTSGNVTPVEDSVVEGKYVVTITGTLTSGSVQIKGTTVLLYNSVIVALT